MSRLASACFFVAIGATAACGGGASAQGAGLSEPIVIDSSGRAVFVPGPLPTPASGATSPAISGVAIQSGQFVAGYARKGISGAVDDNAYTIAVRLKEMGTGYWLFPTGTADTFLEKTLDWSMSLSASRDLPPGKYSLEFVALDYNGVAGPVDTETLTIESLIPPGRTAISLRWNNASDLDLIVVTPSGKIVSPKAITTSDTASAPGATSGPTVGKLDRDSNAACVQDNLRQEDLVWPVAPEPGVYTVYVDLWSACGTSSAPFDVRLIVDGEVRAQIPDVIPAIDADQGVNKASDPNANPLPPGLFVAQWRF